MPLYNTVAELGAESLLSPCRHLWPRHLSSLPLYSVTADRYLMRQRHGRCSPHFLSPAAHASCRLHVAEIILVYSGKVRAPNFTIRNQEPGDCRLEAWSGLGAAVSLREGDSHGLSVPASTGVRSVSLSNLRRAWIVSDGFQRHDMGPTHVSQGSVCGCRAVPEPEDERRFLM